MDNFLRYSKKRLAYFFVGMVYGLHLVRNIVVSEWSEVLRLRLTMCSASSDTLASVYEDVGNSSSSAVSLTSTLFTHNVLRIHLSVTHNPPFIINVKLLSSICTAPIHETSLRGSCIACIVKGYHSFTCAPCISSTSGMSHTFAFPAAAGTHLPMDGTLVQSSSGRDSNLQPLDCKSGTLPHSH